MKRWMSWASLPVRKKLLLLVVFAFLSAGVSIVWVGFKETREAIDDARKDTMSLAESLSAQQERVASGTKYLLSTLSRFPAVRNNDVSGCNALFEAIRGEHPFYSFIGATTADGKIFAASPPMGPDTVDLSDRKHFLDAVKSLRFSVGEFIIGRVSKVPSMNFSYPVLDENNRLVAVLIAGFRLDENERFLSRVNLPAGAVVTITDHRGVRLFRSPAELGFGPGTFIGNDFFRSISGNSARGTFESQGGEEGFDGIFAYKQQYISGEPFPYMYMIVGFSKGKIMHKAVADLAGNLLVLGIVGILACALTWSFGNLTIARPIKRLASAAQSLGKGEMRTRTGLPHTSDELGRLGKAFDEMASLLETRSIEQKKAEDDLVEAYAVMENRVRERTGELSAANAVLNNEIAERKRTEEALRKSEDLYRSLFENMLNGFAHCRMLFEGEKPSDFIYLRVNKAFENLTGLKGVVGKKISEIIPGLPEEDPGLMEIYGRVALTGIPEQFETYVESLGMWFSISVYSPQKEYFVAVFDVITERKRIEEERARLATAIEQVDEGIIITDANWIIQYANPSFERLTGYKYPEIIGRHARILKGETEETPFYRRLRERLARGEGWSGRLVNRKKDGTLYDAEVTASAVRGNSGRIVNYVSIHRDITHVVKLEKELQQAQKMEAIGQLAGGIAHDFNNMLSAITGFTELSLFKLSESSPVRSNLEQVLKAASRASDVVKQILTFSRQTERECKPVHIAPIVDEAMRLLRSTLPTTIRIIQDIRIGADNGVVAADPTQIHQVLMNLCTNAAHAMRTGGGILRVELSEIDGKALSSVYPQLNGGRYVGLTVSDTGVGMDSAVLERIFEPYFTTKGPGEGTGLGLSVVQGLVKSQGGDIAVRSEPGRGTTFQVFLPELDGAPVQEPETVELLPEGRERILLVDDEELLAELGRDILQSLGYAVIAKTSSPEALEAFRADPDAFDVVITDMTMPDLTGRELAAKMLEIRADIPIILCTGFSDQINERLAKEVGVREFVMKPYEMATLARVIRKVVDGTINR